jgi:integrase
MLTVLGGLAEFERHLILARTSEGRQRAQAVKAKRFNWHGLRHFAVSTWIEAGLSPKTVQTFAGHASLQVTMDRYGHLFPSEDHKRAMDHIATTLFTGTLSEH